MQKKISSLFFYVIAALLLTGFATQQVEAQPVSESKAKKEAGQYITKTDNFLLLIDSSNSMDEAYQGKQKLALAKEFASRMNQAIPDLKINSALRKFGSAKFLFDDTTASILSLSPYLKKPFGDALQTINEASGFSPMASGINASSEDLKSAQGKMALIIVSDWDETGFVSNPLPSAEAIKLKYGDRICIYPVMVGKNLEGIKLMENVANVGKCGFATQPEQVASEADMAKFVEKVFFTKALVLDSDKDGVPDDLDKCPNTPAGVKVDKDGCAINDTITLKVEFDTGKSDIKPKYNDEIKSVADYMKKNPQVKAVIEGHTDNVGDEKENLILSQARANSVSSYLTSNFGIEKDRLKSVGYGYKKPIASNSTDEGKQKNRRVQAVISTVVKD